jgi:hypothetical protein
VLQGRTAFKQRQILLLAPKLLLDEGMAKNLFIDAWVVDIQAQVGDDMLVDRVEGPARRPSRSLDVPIQQALQRIGHRRGRLQSRTRPPHHALAGGKRQRLALNGEALDLLAVQRFLTS